MKNLCKTMSCVAIAIILALNLCACGSQTVYVSKSGKKVHQKSDCSGMKYYTTMTYKEAQNKGLDFCDNCW